MQFPATVVSPFMSQSQCQPALSLVTAAFSHPRLNSSGSGHNPPPDGTSIQSISRLNGLRDGHSTESGLHSNPIPSLLELTAASAGKCQWLLNPFMSPTHASHLPPNLFAASSFPAISSTALRLGITPSAIAGYPSPASTCNITLSPYPAPVPGPVPAPGTQKEIVRFSSSSLYPPKASTVVSTTRERPIGCKTIFVGGLPENVTEDLLKEVFQKFGGEINAIRIGKKNFCHIRFEEEDAVDKAISLSGYRMKIGDHDDAPNTGRLHVDFAQARDDQHEWECKQRALQREMRHKERLEQDRFNPPSPPSVHYSEHEAAQLVEMMKIEVNFDKAVGVLVSWLEKGECQKKNSGQFYAMIQTINSNTRRLQTEKCLFEEEMLKARDAYQSRMQGILVQFALIEKVFEVSAHQKVWDHFTKAQRKNLLLWRKQVKEMKSVQVEEVVSKREEDEMDLSDGDESLLTEKKRCFSDEALDTLAAHKVQRLEEDNLCLENSNSSLLIGESTSNEGSDVSHNSEPELLHNKSSNDADNSWADKNSVEKQVQILQQALQGMQYQLLTLRQQKTRDEEEISRLKNLLNQRKDGTQAEANTDLEEQPDCLSSWGKEEARLVSFVSVYLCVHPKGASTQSIYDYLRVQSPFAKSDLLTLQYVESLLNKFSHLFVKLESNRNQVNVWQWHLQGFANNF